MTEPPSLRHGQRVARQGRHLTHRRQLIKRQHLFDDVTLEDVVDLGRVGEEVSDSSPLSSLKASSVGASIVTCRSSISPASPESSSSSSMVLKSPAAKASFALSNRLSPDSAAPVVEPLWSVVPEDVEDSESVVSASLGDEDDESELSPQPVKTTTPRAARRRTQCAVLSFQDLLA